MVDLRHRGDRHCRGGYVRAQDPRRLARLRGRHHDLPVGSQALETAQGAGTPDPGAVASVAGGRLLCGVRGRDLRLRYGDQAHWLARAAAVFAGVGDDVSSAALAPAPATDLPARPGDHHRGGDRHHRILGLHLDKLYRLKKRVSPGKGSAANKAFKKALLDAMGDDLNISIALAVIDEMISNTNDTFDADPKSKSLKKETLANIEFIDTLLGFGGQEPFTYFQIGISEDEKEKIETLIAERSEAKKEKNFERSDAIRDELITMGISIMDTADGTVWEKA